MKTIIFPGAFKAAAIIMVGLCIGTVPAYAQATGFDAESWAELKNRHAMVPALETQLLGMPRENVTALLGAPDERIGTDAIWYVRRFSMFAEDRVLLVQFSQDGIVNFAGEVSTETWQ